jgi:hypothetical protein
LYKGGLAVLHREARVGIALADHAFLERRRLHRRRDDRGVNQRAAFDDQASRVELTVDLGHKLLRQAELLDDLAEPPDRGMVGRLLIERNAAEAPKRQPIAHGFLRAGVGEPVPLLEKHELEHGQRRVGWGAVRRRMQWTHQDVERCPLECLGDSFQEPTRRRIGLDEGVGE